VERWTRLMIRCRWAVVAGWLVVLLAGGYARDVADTVDINAATAAVVAAADAMAWSSAPA